MSELKLKPCPMCGCRAEFDYGAPMNSGKRIVKVKCSIGCVEQNIFRCEEADAALAWNSRTHPPEAVADKVDDMVALLQRLKRDLMTARRYQARTMQTYENACCAAESEIEEFLASIQKDGGGNVQKDS